MKFKLQKSISVIIIFGLLILNPSLSFSIDFDGDFALPQITGELEQATKDPIYLSFGQRLVLSYMIQGIGKEGRELEEVKSRYRQTLSRFVDSEIVYVNSFEEFLRKWKGGWPDTHTLDLDLQLIEQRADIKRKVFVGNSPELSNRIAQYKIKVQEHFLNQMKKKSNDPSETDRRFWRSFFERIEKQGESKSILRDGFSAFIEETFFFGRSGLESQLLALDKIGDKMVSSGHFDKIEGSLKRVMQIVFGTYFRLLSLESKKQVLNIGLGEPLDGGDREKLKILIQGSGPSFQKLLQIMARERGVSVELIEIFKELESKVRAVPEILAKEIIESERHNYAIKSFEPTPRGVGTMAQVHIGEIFENGKIRQVVFRFIKPGMRDRVEEDRRILRELATLIDRDEYLRSINYPPMTPVVDDLIRTVEEELVIIDTIGRQKMGGVCYRFCEDKIAKISNLKGRSLQIQAPGVVDPKTAETNLMVQDLIQGKQLDEVSEKYALEIPDLKKLVVEQIARLWIREVIFGQGFFHADLHQGNFLVDVGNKKVTVNLLDYGMSGVLDRETRKILFALAAGIELNKVNVIAKSFWDLSVKEKNQVSFEEFKSIVADKVEAIKKDRYSNKTSLDDWTALTLKSGIHLPYNFINLNRGFTILVKLLEESGSEFSMELLAGSEAKKRPITMVKKLFETKSVTLFDLVKIAYHYFLTRMHSRSENIQVAIQVKKEIYKEKTEKTIIRLKEMGIDFDKIKNREKRQFQPGLCTSVHSFAK